MLVLWKKIHILWQQVEVNHQEQKQVKMMRKILIFLIPLIVVTIFYSVFLALDVQRYYIERGDLDYFPYLSTHAGQRFSLAGFGVACSWLMFASVRRRNKALVGGLGFLLVLASVGLILSCRFK